VVLLQVCVNELTSIPLFPERRDAIVAACKANIAAIAEATLESSATLILTTVFPVAEASLTRRPVWSVDIPAAIEDVNSFIRAQAAEHVLIFDAYALLVDAQGALRDDYRVDEVHLSLAGYDLLNHALAELLAELAN
jgi:lysophospholipase L1-like esterase